MNHPIRFFPAVLIAAMALTGCSSGGSASGVPSSSADGTGITRTVVSEETVIGKVESIVGNEATLSLGELAQGAAPSRDNAAPSAPSGGNSAASEPKSSGDSSSASSENPGGAAPDSRRNDGGSRPSGNFPGGGSMPEGGGSMPEGGGFSGGGQAAEVTYTGETAVYQLPVGLSIGNDDFSSVSEGMTLRLTIGTFEDGSTAIISVDILSQ